MTYFADKGKDMLEIIRAPAIFEHFVDATGMDVSNYRKILAMHFAREQQGRDPEDEEPSEEGDVPWPFGQAAPEMPEEEDDDDSGADAPPGLDLAWLQERLYG